jgi:CDP-diacylglycerol pyrophosphatase
MTRFLVAIAALLAATGMAHADPDALWKITHDKCVPDQQEHGAPAPCALVDLQGGADKGFVILKDLVGDTQYLLIPTEKITGIESPELLAPDAPNYFADAWAERHFTETAAKRDLPRSNLSLAVNSTSGRSQNQLHIHIDCVAPAVRDAVLRNIAAIGDKWAPFPEPLVGHQYRAIRVSGETLDGVDPFKSIADGVPGARGTMGNQTLAVVGVDLPGGAPGFVILNDQADADTGDRGAAEDLQDHSCALAKQ